MSESKRKQAQRKRGRAERHGGVLRRRKQDQEAATPAQAEPAPQASDAKQEGADPKADDTSKVSSLLETSSKEVKQLLEAADDAAEKIREAAKAEAQVASDDQPGESGKSGKAMSLISQTNTEVQKVLEAADDAAEKIREEARGEARQLIEETRRRAESVTSEQMNNVSQMTEQVLGELSAIQDQLETLRTAFDHAIEKMGFDLGVEQSSVWDTQNGAGDEEEESAELRSRLGRRHKSVHAPEPDGISEGARLLALQQLMAGVDADVIQERLTNEFGIKDPKPILDWMGIHAEPPEKPKKR
jgi:vacuolar-type H+-ATPase subunit E/Vma4